MSYEEALRLEPGDSVSIIDTKEKHAVVSISGTPVYLFILLDDGSEFRHDELQK